MNRDPEEPGSNAEDNPEAGTINPEDSIAILRIPRRYKLTEKGRARLSELGRARWATARVLEQREQELAAFGPADLAMVQCPECGSWSESAANLERHRLTVHPIENAVAGETKTSPERVTSVWIEACNKQQRHPGEAPEQIVRRFWDAKDREILERLLARGAVFRFREEE